MGGDGHVAAQGWGQWSASKLMLVTSTFAAPVAVVGGSLSTRPVATVPAVIKPAAAGLSPSLLLCQLNCSSRDTMPAARIVAIVVAVSAQSRECAAAN